MQDARAATGDLVGALRFHRCDGGSAQARRPPASSGRLASRLRPLAGPPSRRPARPRPGRLPGVARQDELGHGRQGLERVMVGRGGDLLPSLIHDLEQPPALFGQLRPPKAPCLHQQVVPDNPGVMDDSGVAMVMGRRSGSR
jgi:hypothetical protein